MWGRKECRLQTLRQSTPQRRDCGVVGQEIDAGRRDFAGSLTFASHDWDLANARAPTAHAGLPLFTRKRAIARTMCMSAKGRCCR